MLFAPPLKKKPCIQSEKHPLAVAQLVGNLPEGANLMCDFHRTETSNVADIGCKVKGKNPSDYSVAQTLWNVFFNATSATTRGTNHHELFHAGQRCMLYDVKVTREYRAYVQSAVVPRSPRWGNEAHTTSSKIQEVNILSR